MKGGLLTIIALLIIFITGVVVTFNILKPVEKLKIYKPADLNPKLVVPELRNSRQAHKISDFSLLDQSGEVFTEKDLEGKIYVADFFFTTCPSICPAMSRQMKRVHDEFENNKEIMLVSHTVMPETDSPEVLAEYAARYGADGNKWKFLTGDKKEIYDLARKSYFAVTTEGDGDEHDFIHTENLILVDKQKRIRGFYDGTSPEDVDRLIREINILNKEK
jgi:protein SCO1